MRVIPRFLNEWYVFENGKPLGIEPGLEKRKILVKVKGQVNVLNLNLAFYY